MRTNLHLLTAALVKMRLIVHVWHLVQISTSLKFCNIREEERSIRPSQLSSLKKLFIHYNAILPSSAAAERLFSFAGLITRPHRRCLSDKTFEKLLLLKENVLWTFVLLGKFSSVSRSADVRCRLVVGVLAVVWNVQVWSPITNDFDLIEMNVRCVRKQFVIRVSWNY